jgi:hypothetical protein
LVHYRSGKGDNVITALTTAPDGKGSIWQIQLDHITVGDVQFDNANPVKVVDGIGCPSPFGVVAVGDDVHFPNLNGVYSLGSKPTLLNVLATSRLTANIDPTWRSLRKQGLRNICACYHDGKVFWSIPYSTTTNNRTMVYDTERRNLNPEAFTIGFSRLGEYMDDSGNLRLLGIRPGHKQLIQISDQIDGDLGQAFSTSLKSGRQPVSSDRRDWGKIPYVTVYLGKPRGNIKVEVSGTIKGADGFKPISSVTIPGATTESASGWGTFGWEAAMWGVSPNKSQIVSEDIVTRKIRVNRLINDWQVRTFTDERKVRYTLLGYHLGGAIVPTQDPSRYVIKPVQ